MTNPNFLTVCEKTRKFTYNTKDGPRIVTTTAKCRVLLYRLLCFSSLLFLCNSFRRGYGHLPDGMVLESGVRLVGFSLVGDEESIILGVLGQKNA